MKSRRLYVYIVSVCAAGVGVLPLLNWADLGRLGQGDLLGLLALTVLGLLSESLALTIKFGGSAGNSSITFLPLLACVLVFGPAPAVLFIATTGLVAEFLIRRKELVRAVFNIGQYLLSTGVAGLAFEWTGGRAQLTHGTLGVFDFQLLPFATFSVVFLVMNHASVSVAVALHQGVPFQTVFARMFGRASGTNIFYDLLVAPIAVAVAFLYIELQVTGLLVLLLPLLFIRHSYLTYYRLLKANRDLLKVLVKAIETRDPYTSGHSMRVSFLSKSIAMELGLPGRQIESIETAALLHDIGKIDAVFTGILRKQSGLTDEERAIIESHVTRGVELLETLASFPNEILDAVRYHHERIDGRGYPEGLTGTAIPLSARIVNICDAVDAMLSDRPYRAALTLASVRRELALGKGTQFDAQVVDRILMSDLLERHQAKMLSTSEVDPPFVVEALSRQTPTWPKTGRARRRSQMIPSLSPRGDL